VDVTEIKEKDLAQFRRERLGFVFQEFNLLDTLTIEENIGIALTISHTDPAQVQQRVEETAARLCIKEVLGKFPYQVSGGQKQRAACARAIVNNQSLILADEPTGALDSKSAKNLLEIMSRMNMEMNATIIMVTHDAYSASYASRVLFLKDGKLFNELIKGDKKRMETYNEILDVLALLGGELYGKTAE
jgi:putative ABC transport system ATP-binding protein